MMEVARGAAMGTLGLIVVPTLWLSGVIGWPALLLAAAFYVVGIFDGRAMRGG